MVGLPWIAVMASFMQAFGATILNATLPAIAHNLNRSPLAMQSAIISYTLTVVMFTPANGWLADRFGTRCILTLTVSPSMLGSLAYALSDSLPQLAVFRVIQGIGDAMMMPVAWLALLRVYPHNELLLVLDFVAVPSLVRPILDPVLGSVLATWITWHWISLVNIPTGTAGLLHACKHMPNSATTRHRFDTTGFLLFGLGSAFFSSGTELLGEKIVASWIALMVAVTNIGLLLLYILHARRTPNPLISLDLFKTRTLSIGIVGNIATRLGTGCVPSLMLLVSQAGFRYQAFVAGCMMVPTVLGPIVAKLMVTRALRRPDYRHALMGIMAIIGPMIAQLFLQPPAMMIWMLILLLSVLGVIMSTRLTAVNTITPADLTDDNASSGNSVLAVTQQLSISLGVAVSAAVLHVYEGTEGTTTVEQFHYTFITVGIITVVPVAMFMLLKTTDGSNLIKRQRKSKPNHIPSESE